MSNWEHIENSDTVYETLNMADCFSIEIFHESECFYIQADVIGTEIDLGTADTLDAAKKLAERWALAQIGEMLKSLGAEGIWLVRGALAATLAYYHVDDDSDPIEIVPSQPHKRVLLARFPAGDGGEAGVEHF